MTPNRKIVAGYLMAAGFAFLAGYLFLGIRELGLYYLLLFINLPASAVIEPGMERVFVALDRDLGGPAHVWTTQIACMAANGAVLASFVNIVQRLLKAKDRGKADTA